MNYLLTEAKRQVAIVKAADDLHSKIDMDIEDHLKRELTLEESTLVGVAVLMVLKTLEENKNVKKS